MINSNEHGFAIATNLVYIAMGIMVLIGGSTASVRAAIAFVGLGLGSSYYHIHADRHGTYGHWLGRRTDWGGIFLLFSLLALLGMGLTEWYWTAAVWTAGILSINWIVDYGPTMVGLTLSPALIGASLQGHADEALVCLLIYLVAYGIRSMGGNSSWLHGVWHPLTAIATLGLYGILAF